MPIHSNQATSMLEQKHECSCIYLTDHKFEQCWLLLLQAYDLVALLDKSSWKIYEQNFGQDC